MRDAKDKTYNFGALSQGQKFSYRLAEKSFSSLQLALRCFRVLLPALAVDFSCPTERLNVPRDPTLGVLGPGMPHSLATLLSDSLELPEN